MTIVITLPLGLAQLAAQARGGRGGPPPNPKAAAPIDLTGYWVSIVTEDWRYRMVTPAPGDYQGVPMTPAAVKIADAWDPGKGRSGRAMQCKSYGAPAMLRVPEHLHITWQDDQTLRMDTDAGKQTRLFHFGDWKACRRPRRRCREIPLAEWEMQRAGRAASGRIAQSHDDPSEGRLSCARTVFPTARTPISRSTTT